MDCLWPPPPILPLSDLLVLHPLVLLLSRGQTGQAPSRAPLRVREHRLLHHFAPQTIELYLFIYGKRGESERARVHYRATCRAGINSTSCLRGQRCTLHPPRPPLPSFLQCWEHPGPRGLLLVRGGLRPLRAADLLVSGTAPTWTAGVLAPGNSGQAVILGASPGSPRTSSENTFLFQARRWLSGLKPGQAVLSWHHMGAPWTVCGGCWVVELCCGISLFLTASHSRPQTHCQNQILPECPPEDGALHAGGQAAHCPHCRLHPR